MGRGRYVLMRWSNPRVGGLDYTARDNLEPMRTCTTVAKPEDAAPRSQRTFIDTCEDDPTMTRSTYLHIVHPLLVLSYQKEGLERS